MMLAFSLANGMARFENMDEEDIWSFLDLNSAEILYHFIQSINGPTSREISKKLFDGAIVRGNADVVKFMTTHKSLDIDVNEHVCTFKGKPYTPVELSSKMRHYMVTYVLIQNGANIDKSCNPEYRYGRALIRAFDLSGDPPIDLVDL
ncbi:hypothetical protein F5Y02DRAFT_340375 [Annulohypoxylon stygium]|nr:hypothetical protein F5Y02DRAFT_340375 [Annulohypoxylon stygium]